MRRTIDGLMATLMTAAAIPAGAQATAPEQPASTTASATQRRYDAAYFANFAPATALQMVERVPGFSIETVDPTVRGFGQTAGNIVINGQRPSAKSEALETILARIPANRVARIDVAPGDRFGADYSAKAQVLNLVLTAGGGLAGTVEGSASRDFAGKVRPGGSASALVRRGKSTFNVSMTIDNSTTSEEGTDRIVALPGGTLREFRRKMNTIDDPNVSVAGSWEYDGGTNRTAHLNGRVLLDRFKLTQRNDVFPAAGVQRDDRLTDRSNTDEYELGGDVTRPFAGGGLKLIGLATRRYRDNAESAFNRIAGQTIGGFTQASSESFQESVARILWSKSDVAGWKLEIGAEGVINQLDSEVDLFTVQPGAAPIRIDLPVDNAVVREVRGEAFVNAGRAVGRDLRLDLGLTQEASRLTVTGDAAAERSLSFLKPKVTLDWRPAGKWRAQLSVQRTVAQLQFEDFISGAELANERVNGGNVDLLPQRAWEALATIERKILGDGLYRVELGYNRVSLVQDRVPTPEGFDAPGNLGDGTVLVVRNRLDAPLSGFGIKGGRLTVNASYTHSSVVDPYTLSSRPFSGAVGFLGDLTFRQDLKKFAWGFTLEGRSAITFFRREETDRSTSDAPYITAFAEYRPDARTSINLTLDNVTGAHGRRDRTFYTPDRRNPAASAIEYRERNRHTVPLLTVKRSFG